MKIYNVLCRDRHTDTTATPFLDLDKAIEFARESAKSYHKYPEDLFESNIAGWLFHINYSCEGDCLWITEHEVDGQ